MDIFEATIWLNGEVRRYIFSNRTVMQVSFNITWGRSGHFIPIAIGDRITIGAYQVGKIEKRARCWSDRELMDGKHLLKA